MHADVRMLVQHAALESPLSFSSDAAKPHNSLSHSSTHALTPPSHHSTGNYRDPYLIMQHVRMEQSASAACGAHMHAVLSNINANIIYRESWRVGGEGGAAGRCRHACRCDAGFVHNSLS